MRDWKRILERADVAEEKIVLDEIGKNLTMLVTLTVGRPGWSQMLVAHGGRSSENK